MKVDELEDDAQPLIHFPTADADDAVPIQPHQHVSLGRRPRKKAPPERLPWFDQWRGARGPALRSLVTTIRDALDKHETAKGHRKRTRRHDDQRIHEIAVETVIANLAHSALSNT